VQVRGVGSDGKPGQWTDPQRVDVTPKAPRNVRLTGKNTYGWDKVPYPKASYQVEVVDSSGKVLNSTQTKDAEYELPDSVVKNAKLAKQTLTLKVRTHVDGVPLSVANSQKFTTAMAEIGQVETTGPSSEVGTTTAGATPALPARPLTPAEIIAAHQPRELPPQPLAEALTPEDAVMRYTLTGERPIAASPEEWALAKTPEQKEQLRRRTIASARVELMDRMDRKHPVDLRFSAELGMGAWDYRLRAPGDDTSEKNLSGMGPAYHLRVDYGHERPWGYFIDFHQRNLAQAGTTQSFTSFGLGAEKHVPLDSLWETVLDFGFGLEYSEHPYLGDADTDHPAFTYPMATLGLALNTGYHYWVNDHWRADLGLGLRVAPPQTNISDEVKDVLLYGGELKLGPTYKFDREMELSAGLAIRGEHAGTDKVRSVSLVERTLYVQGTYRMSGSEERRPAAEMRYEAESKKPWELRLMAPVGFRYDTSYTSENNEPANATSMALKPEVSLRRKMGANSAWSAIGAIGGGGYSANGVTAEESYASLHAGYEKPLFGRRDASVQFTFGPGFRDASTVLDSQAHRLNATEIQGEVQFEKSWSDQLSSQVSACVGVPISVKSKSGQSSDSSVTSSSSSGAATKDGFNYTWKLSANVGYRVSRDFSVFGGYGYQQLRYSVHDQNAGSFEAVGYVENQLQFGVGYRW
jgi:hypothetical protein